MWTTGESEFLVIIPRLCFDCGCCLCRNAPLVLFSEATPIIAAGVNKISATMFIYVRKNSPTGIFGSGFVIVA